MGVGNARLRALAAARPAQDKHDVHIGQRARLLLRPVRFCRGGLAARSWLVGSHGCQGRARRQRAGGC